jgi:tripartite motif-containing protein 71
VTERTNLRSRRFRRACTLAALAATAAIAVGPSAIGGTVAQGAVAVPTFADQIGQTSPNPGRATMYPSGLDVDGSGNVYIADTGNDQVEAYNTAGTRLWQIGDRGPKAPGRFNNPRDVAFLAGRLYVMDSGYNRVQVLSAANGAPISVAGWASKRFPSTLGISAGVDGARRPIILVALDVGHKIEIYRPDGTFVRAVGSGPGSGNGQLNGPRDAATDAIGNIYVADYANDRIAKFNAQGVWQRNFGTTPGGSANGQFKRPYGVDLDAAQNLYVADTGVNQRIQKIRRSDGRWLATYGGAGSASGQIDKFLQLRRVAVGPGTSPDVYGADLWDYKIIRFNQNRTFDRVYGNNPPEGGFFNEPSGLSIDPGSNRLYVADAVNQRIQYFSASSPYGLIARFGQRGWGNGAKDGFNWPRDVVVHPGTGTLWVADTKNSRLVEFTRDGEPTGRKLGALGSEVGKLNWPWGLAAIGSGGDLVVADTNNHRVQRWNPSTGVVWTATGFNFPKDVDIDRTTGTVYVADSKSKRVVALDGDTGAQLRSFGTAQLHSPEGIVFDSTANTVWVADTSFNRLVEYTAGGGFVRSFGSAGTGRGQFNRPTHLEIAGRRLFVADTWNDRVQIFDLN